MGHWVPLTGRQGGTIPAIVLSPDFRKDQLAFAATNAGIFRSEDGGKSWKISGDPLSSFAAQSIVCSPFFPKDRTLFAGAADGGVHRSTDGGDSWTLLGRVGDGSGVVALAAVPTAGGIAVMAGTLADGVFFSGNGGDEWKPCNSGLPDLSVIGLAMSPAFEKDRTAFVATEGGLQQTTNGGNSWKQVWASQPDNSIQCLVISPNFATDRRIFAGTEKEGILGSADGGASWHSLNSGLPDLSINALALSPEFPQDPVIAAAVGQGISLSPDGGQSWSLVAAEPEMVLSLAVSDRGAEAEPAGRVILAGLVGGGVIESRDGGRSWERANQGLDATYLVNLALSPEFDSDSTLFTWGLTEGVFRSENSGQSWQPASAGIQGITISALALSPSFATDGRLYATTSNGLYQSLDRGASWHGLGLSGQGLNLLALSPTFSEDSVMAAAAANAVYWSADGGANWSPLEAPADDETLVAATLALDADGKHVLLVATWRVPLYYRRGRLRVWSRTLPDAPWSLLFSRDSDTRTAILAVPDTFSQDQKFFIGNAEAVYHIVPDATERTREGIRPIWLPAWVGTHGLPVVSLVAVPDFARSHTLLAAGGDGVFVSQDEGARWQRLGETLGDRSPVAVAPSPRFLENGVVYALTLGGQLWRWDPTDQS